MPKPDYAARTCHIVSTDVHQGDFHLANEVEAIRYGARYHSRFSVHASQGPCIAEVLVKREVCLIGRPGEDITARGLTWQRWPGGGLLADRHGLPVLPLMNAPTTRASIWIDLRNHLQTVFHPSSPHLTMEFP